MTNAELAILSLVAERPRHGYQIEQVIEERGMREWTEVGFSSIYYLLNKLERAAWVEGRLEQAGPGPARKVYQATPAGLAALREGVLDALSVPHRCYLPIQVGLSCLPVLSPAEAAEALGRYRTALAGRLAGVQAAWRRQQPLPPNVQAQFDHSVSLIRAEMDWVDRTLARLGGEARPVFQQEDEE